MNEIFTRGGDADEHVVDVTGTEYHTVSEAVMWTVAAYSDRDPRNLEPLTSSIDPDTLDTLSEPALDDSPSPLREITFEYAGFRITVSTRGEIRLRPSHDRTHMG